MPQTDADQLLELKTQTDTLEANLTQHKEDFLEYSERVYRIETTIANQTDMSNTGDNLGISNETSASSWVDFESLNETVTTIETKLDKESEMTQEGLDNITARLTELESDNSRHWSYINQLTKGVLDLNETMKQIEAATMQFNVSLTTIEETVNQEHNGRLVKLETNQQLTHASIDELQSDEYKDKEMIENNTLRIVSVETAVDNHQVFTTNLEAIVIQLESNINRTQSDVGDTNHKISLLGNNVTSLVEFSEDQLQHNIEFVSNLTAIRDTIKDYNETIERIKVN